MKKSIIKIQYEDEKLKALKLIFAKKNKDLEAEIKRYIDNLYKKNVPKVLQSYIEESEDIQSIPKGK